jgi:hypothetical protein
MNEIDYSIEMNRRSAFTSTPTSPAHKRLLLSGKKVVLSHQNRLRASPREQRPAAMLARR